MLEIEYAKSFKKAFKKLNESEKKLTKDIIWQLANNEELASKYKDHALIGSYKGFRECHVKPDLLLIYKKQNEILLLTCVEIGSHSELFQ
ncbi:type II toxin-antitoxin system YafQ family toxin [Campylobacter concisus]|uniref:type II toxin-antitoxin system YafQ family toxin n=1 Tax=Campylobacter concisus TaxID=199 RepID=UPI000CD993A9|nr:type II toxin-antitoxin system YafQ family toxin [Campylobacter concisus]